MSTTPQRHRYGRLPDDAPVLCDDPLALNHDPSTARRWRFTLVLTRRVRRLVRRVLRCRRPLRRGRPAWTARGLRGVGHAHCACTACRYHLAEFFREKPLKEACALVVMRRGPLTQPEVGKLLHMTGANVGEIEREGLARLRRGQRRRDGESVKEEKKADTLEDRVLAVLEYGEANYVEIAAKAGASCNGVRAMLQKLYEAGAVIPRERGHSAGRSWRLVGR